MADGKLAFIITARDLASKEFKKVNGEIAKMEKQTKGAKTGLGGLLGSINPLKVALFGAVAAGAAFVGILVDAGGQAIAEQRNIARLTASLKANALGWDGNITAVEKVISQREQLAFSDDELRDSLTTLVGVTKDVDKAFALQAVAMDLARFSGGSLHDASEALIRVEAGQYRALKGLIGSTKDIKNEMQAVAAVTKVAAGQAAAYANTVGGKMEAAQIRISDAMEDFGTVILPAVATALDVVMGHTRQLADISDSVANEVIEGNVAALQVARDAIIQSLSDLSAAEGQNDFLAKLVAGSQVDALRARLAEVDQAILDNTTNYEQHIEDLREASRRNLTGPNGVTKEFRSVSDVVKDMADTTEEAADDIGDAFKKARDVIIDDSLKEIDAAYDLISEKARLTAVNIEIAELRKVIATGKGTAAQKAHMQDLQKEQAHLLAEVVAKGGGSYKAVHDAVNQIRDRLKTATGAERTALLAELKLLQRLEKQAKETAQAIYDAIVAKYGKGLADQDKDRGRATGGPVWPGETYRVGESGEETLVMNAGGGGYVIPHASSSGSSGGGWGGTNVIRLVVSGKVLAEVVEREQFYRSKTRAGR